MLLQRRRFSPPAAAEEEEDSDDEDFIESSQIEIEDIARAATPPAALGKSTRNTDKIVV